MLRIIFLCTDDNHPIRPYLDKWILDNKSVFQINMYSNKKDINLEEDYDFLFLISCSQIISQAIREKFKYSLVIHASNLPEGRGWSPHIWDLLEGKKKITVSLLNAEDKVDSGDLWKKIDINIAEHELSHEINKKLFSCEMALVDYALKNFNKVKLSIQKETEGKVYREKRTPEDSEIDPYSSLSSQFNLIRVSDYERYPAFFNLHGYKYKIKLEKLEDES